MNTTHTHRIGLSLVALALVALATDGAQAGVVTDFSNFSETGNILTGSNTREQSFTPSGANVTIAHFGGSNAGHEMYLTSEFDTLAAGDRVSVDWAGKGSEGSVNFEQWGLAIRTGVVASGQNAIFWTWKSGGEVSLTVRDNTTGSGTTVSATPDTLFIDRTATGWSFGSITGGTETLHFTDINSFGGVNITADGSAVGFFSDMRSTTNPKTLTNFTVPMAIPAPAALPAGLAMLGLAATRRRRMK